MDRKPENGTYRVLPDRAQQCVWMLAGLLSYRLCDREYDCERCPLDAAIRGVATPSSRAAETREGPPGAWIRDGLRYHPAYGWVADAPEGRLRWGIDGVAATLLDHVTSVVLPPVGASLLQGQVACWVVDDGELLPLRSPISGTVAGANREVQRDPSLVTHEPYDAGWLIEAQGVAGRSASLPGLCDAEERRAAAARQLGRFHRAASSYLHVDQSVGVTLQDGGQRLHNLRAALGRARYHRLVLSLLR